MFTLVKVVCLPPLKSTSEKLSLSDVVAKVAVLTMHSHLSKSFQIAFLLLLASTFCSGLRFDIESGVQKCFTEELGKDILVVGEYTVPVSLNTYTRISVTGPDGNEIWNNQRLQTGSFSFLTEQGGDHMICFLDASKNPQEPTPMGEKKRVTFKLKTGVEAKDYSEVAKREDLRPIEVELLRVEDLLWEINHDMNYFRKREADLRFTNESTSSRVHWLSLTTVFIVVVLGIWQIMYLKQYFMQKKLI